MKKFWLSWFHNPAMGEFELHSPWWVSGERSEDRTICAAVRATDESNAKEIVSDSYDMRPETIEWRFCELRSADWSPFCTRFQKADWMVWPPAGTEG